jgi:putative copper export protein/methionine-rich copper-binding protein CopC
MRTKPGVNRSRLNGALLFGGCLFLLPRLLIGVPTAAAETVSVEPPSNAVLDTSPRQVVLRFDMPVEPADTQLAVLTSGNEPVSVGQSRSAPDDRSALIADLPSLKPGVYTVVGRTARAGAEQAAVASAFVVNAGQNSPILVTQPQPMFSLSPLDRAIPRWLAYVTMMISVGALALRFLVWAPSLRRSTADGQRLQRLAVRVDRRLTWLATAALVLFVPSTFVQFAWEAGNAARRPLANSFDPGLLAGFLATPGTGTLWSVRLAVSVMAVIVAGVVAAQLRGGRSPSRLHANGLFAILCLCASEQLLRTLPTSPPPDLPRAVFTSALDWSHLVGGAVWVGGLIGLSVTASLLLPRADAPAGVAVAVIRKFSLVALVCVGVMALSGLWTAWIHVGSPALLLTTLYGQTLMLKLVLVAVLVGLGALNLLWVLPRLEAIRDSDPRHPSLASVALQHFRRLIGMEVAIGVAIFMVVPFLSGSARNQAAQAASADLTQTVYAGDLPISLKPSALQPGLVDYDVTVPAGDVRRVTLTFGSAELGIPDTSVLATARGNGAFRVTGVYTPIVGAWRAQVSVRQASGERSASFALPVRAEPVPLPPNPAPPILTSTWLYGTGEFIGVLLLLLVAAARLSRWVASRRGISRGSQLSLDTGHVDSPILERR